MQLNAIPDVPLSECRVTGVDGLSGKIDPARLNTAYVDLTCPDDPAG